MVQKLLQSYYKECILSMVESMHVKYLLVLTLKNFKEDCTTFTSNLFFMLPNDFRNMETVCLKIK